ncbi:MAG: hypothetical protein WBD10_08510 [Acidobacteriaceae bacterium]
MDSNQRGVPAGVVIAAVVLGLMTFAGLLIAAFSAFALFVAHSALIPRIPSVRIVAGGLDALILALVILAACTIVGLFRLKVWARYSITLLGLLDLLVFSLMTAGVLVGRVKSGMASMSIPNNPNITLGDILLWLAGFYAALALIGVWWMIYFNTSRVRKFFAASQPSPAPEESPSQSFPGLQ